MHRRALRSLLFAAGLFALVAAVERFAAGEEPQLEVVLEGLSNPWGLALQPRGGRIFVANSGAGEILAVDLKTKQSLPVVTGFPTELAGPEGTYRLGPVGLAFSASNMLLVSTLAAAGANPVRTYGIAKEPATVAWDSSASRVSTAPQGRRVWRIVPSASGALAAATDGQTGWIERWPHGKQATADRLVEPAALAGGQGAWGLTASPQGELVIGLGGGAGELRDSRIVFCGARSGRTLLASPVELRDLVDLTYSPKTGRLYAADFSASLPAEGGLFRLDASAEGGVNPVRIAAVERPTALAIADDGALYAAQLSGPIDGQGRAGGRVVRVPGVW